MSGRNTRATLAMLAGTLSLAAGGTLLLRTGRMTADPTHRESPTAEAQAEEPAGARQNEEPRFRTLRAAMIARQLKGRDITDPLVLAAMGRVPRHEFVSPPQADAAYDDHPLPIGHGQTISQPYIVALMTQAVGVKPQGRALDVGTGSGYQAAVLAELYREVCTIEIVEPLAAEARARLTRLGYRNITLRQGDGYRGWTDQAPFDAIVVAAAPDHVPQALLDQLAPGGRLVIPVGRWHQELLLVEKRADGSFARRSLAPVAFVPMTGGAQSRK